MIRAIRSPFLLLPVLLAACLAPADLPPRQGSAVIERPDLLPLSTLLAQGTDGPNAPRLTDSTEDRAAALRARAARLRGPVIAQGERQRLVDSEGRIR